MDFRLGFGQAFGEDTEVVAIDRAEPVHDHPRAVAAELYGGFRRSSTSCAPARVGPRFGLAARVAGAAARRRGRAPRRGGQRVRRCARAASPDAVVRRAARGPRPRRDRDRRRRRLRLLRGARHGLLRARLLARSGAVRVPRLRTGLRARGEARAPGPPGRAARRRRASDSAAWNSTRSRAMA
jgi:hypothetical protein